MFFIQQTSIGPNFILIVLKIQKNKHRCNFHYVAMSMVTSQILRSVDFTETQKSTMATLFQKFFCSRGNFKQC